MRLIFVMMCMVALLVGGRAGWAQADATITYQGALQAGGAPVTGDVDLRMRLYDAATEGAQVGPQITRSAQSVQEGLLAVDLDFGLAAFDGKPRWLEVDVRSAGAPSFTTLAPRQRIAPAPVAVAALKPWTIDGADAFFVGERLGVGEPFPLTKLHVTSIQRDFDPSVLAQDDIVLEDTDAIIGLISDGGGVAGSGITLKQIDGMGGLLDNWAMYRSTSGAGSELQFTYGADARYALNPPVLTLDPDGDASVARNLSVDGGVISTGEPLVLNVGGIEGMRIRRVGDVSLVGIGASDPGFALDVFSPTSTAINGEGFRGVYGKTSSHGGAGVLGFAEEGSGRSYAVEARNYSPEGRAVYAQAHSPTGLTYGVIGVSNSPGGYDFFAAGEGVDYGTLSSRRWKRNIEPIDAPLAKLSQLRGVYYDWDEAHGGKRDVGMIAEEVGAVLPQIVQYEENGVDAVGMDYSKLTPLLVEAVKAMRAEQEAELALLRAQNEALQDRLESLEALIAHQAAGAR